MAAISSAGELLRIAIADQQRTSMTTGADVTSALAWSPEGIVFTRSGALWIIPPVGEARALTTLNAARRKCCTRRLWCLPGGRVVLFASLTSDADGQRIEAVPIAGGERTVLVERANTPVWSPTGHLLFSRDGAMLAVPFDPATARVTGPAVPVVPAGMIGQQAAGGLTFRLSQAAPWSMRRRTTTPIAWCRSRATARP